MIAFKSVMRKISLFAVFVSSLPLACGGAGNAKHNRSVAEAAAPEPDPGAEQLRHFMLKRVPRCPRQQPEDWQKEAERLRQHELSVIYHGWPQEWVDAKPKFEKVAEIARPGYRIVKFRYEIVPGFTSTALLYEPEHMTERCPRF